MARHRLRTLAGLARLGGPYFAFVALRHVVPLETLVRWAWREPRAGRRDPAAEARTVQQAIKLTHLFDRGDRHCLPRSLTLYRALSRAGASPRLFVGFRSLEGRVDGHAWIAVDGAPVGEAEALIDSLTPTCAFGARGTAVAIDGAAAVR